jgi:hypothetical protein
MFQQEFYVFFMLFKNRWRENLNGTNISLTKANP